VYNRCELRRVNPAYAKGSNAVPAQPGTTVTLVGTRPLNDQSDPLLTHDLRATSYDRRDGESILLVDDEAAVRALLARVLRARGYLVTEAADGDQALMLAAEHGRPFHLLLTDVIMPRVGGVELAARLRASGLARCVIFMTGYANIPIAHGEAAAVLRKPFVLASLAEAVRRALDAS
jgi:CheY-like chemotaxis protein